MKMNNILITGGLGFVGGRLTKKLSEDKHNTLLVSSRHHASSDVLSAHGAQQSILHNDLLSNKTFPKDIHTVIHLAALNEIDCVAKPSEAIKVNIDETRILVENSIEAGVKLFIYFSTAHVYGSPLQGIVEENTLPVPIHPYAITHKAAEDYVVAAGRQRKIRTIVVRLSNSFGAPIVPTVNRWTLLVNDLCRQAIEKQSLTLTSNGCQYRDFVCLSDVATAINTIVNSSDEKFDKTLYNLGSGIGMTVLDMTKRIAQVYFELFGVELPIHLPADKMPTEEPRLRYSTDRIQSAGVEIINDFDREIKELLLFCQKNFKKID